jgi:hypothetical protein
MSEMMLLEPTELSDAELDLVTGGLAVAGGLVNVALNDVNLNLLNGLNLDITAPITIRNVANNNNVGVGAIIQLLGGPAAIVQRQAQA